MARRVIPRTPLLIAALAAVSFAAQCSRADAELPSGPRAPEARRRPVARRSLPRFESDADFRAYAQRLARRLEERSRRGRGRATADAELAAPTEAQATTTAAAGEAGATADSSITNTQEAGVDEGGIVKTHGDHLVVLRRGRLFSIDLSGGQRRAVSRVDVPAPGGPGSAGVWYDEMLVWRDTIVVIGYSYQSSGTEIVLFDIDRAGVIRPRGRHHLRSNDYYSSRNYASRLLGSRLVFYLPYGLFEHRYVRGALRVRTSLPAVREADGRAPGEWRDVIRSTDIHRPIQDTDSPVLHTVVTCDLATPDFRCDARGILGPYGRTFYVSREAVYVWVHAGWEGDGEAETGATQGGRNTREPSAVVYRLPLDAGAMGAIRVSGAPTDQLSFREAGGELDVLVRAEGGGDWMWGPEVTQGDVALVRMPLGWFSEGLYTAPREAYAELPRPAGWSLQNRFVGDSVLYGTGGGWGGPAQGAERSVHVHDLRTRQSATLTLDHGVDRIEVMGEHAMVVGSDSRNLVFSTVSLGARPERVGRFVREGATQGETRTHGFFYRSEGPGRGVLGLPVRRGDAEGWEHLAQGSAEVLFLRSDAGRLTRAGELRSNPGAGANDSCRASCVDWYGNARPIFYRGRVFALLGYELVEGRLDPAGMSELGRTSFLHPQR